MFHVKHEGWEARGRAFGLQLDESQQALLDAFSTLLRERAIPLGFVSATDAGRVNERHVEDSLRAAALVQASDRSAYDLGSGAGLPGIPVAIACPWISIGLVESRRPRAAFLELAVEALGLDTVSVLHRRAEELSDKVSLCFARAFASVSASWAASERLLVSGGRLVYFAGEGFEAEQLPSGPPTEVFAASALARSGPLVIMTQT